MYYFIDLAKPGGNSNTEIAVVLACTVVLCTIIAAIMLLICIAFKMKARRMINLPEHEYESVSLPPNTITTSIEPIKFDYNTDTQFELTENEAYGTVKPPPAAETGLQTATDL